MLKDFNKFIISENLFSSKEKVLLAVSGGIDSVVMTDLFKRSGLSFGIAHCNFQLRGNDSEEDELFVAELAKKNKVPFFSQRFSTLHTAQSLGISVQMAARELRYGWFAEVLRKEKYSYIATAHHLDDQVETFFINLLRSSGIAGFHGILPKQGKIIRPLLFATRENINHYATDNHIKYREDKSNNDIKYLRNKIRHEILPVLQEINPDVIRHIGDNLERIREAEQIFRKTIEQKRKKIIRSEKEKITIPIGEIRKLNPQGTYLFEFLSPFGFNFSQVNDLLKSLDKISGKKLISHTHILIKDRENLYITPVPGQHGKPHFLKPVLLTESTKSITSPVRLKITQQKKDKTFRIDPDPSIAFLELHKLHFPLFLRKWQRGDYFYPFGQNHKKKLSDFFIDQKFSLLDKENTWLLVSGKEIVWIIGHRIDNRFRITSKTKEVLRIKWSK